MESSAAALRNLSTPGSRRRSAVVSGVAGMMLVVLGLSACGGDDDDGAAESSSTTTTIAGLSATSTTVARTTTVAPATTTLPALVFVTDGATIVVANASGVDGAAGRMTDALEEAGFAAADATNSSEGPLSTTKIYYAPDDEAAKAVADSVREALGAGDIEVLELADPAPLSDPSSIGEASVLVAIGNDVADKPLDVLQGRAAGTDDSADEATADEATADEATAESSDDASDDASADG